MRLFIITALVVSLLINFFQALQLYTNKGHSLRGTTLQPQSRPSVPRGKASSSAINTEEQEIGAKGSSSLATIEIPWSVAREIVDKVPCNEQLKLTDDFATLLALTAQQRKEVQVCIDTAVAELRVAEKRSAQKIVAADGTSWIKIPPITEVQLEIHAVIKDTCSKILGSEATNILCEGLFNQSILSRDDSTTLVNMTTTSEAQSVEKQTVIREEKYDQQELVSVAEYVNNSAVEWRYNHLLNNNEK